MKHVKNTRLDIDLDNLKRLAGIKEDIDATYEVAIVHHNGGAPFIETGTAYDIMDRMYDIFNDGFEKLVITKK